MRRLPFDWECICSSRAGTARASMVLCVLSVGGCATGPDFTRPVPPSATRYTAETLRGEGASDDYEVQHIALGQNIQGAWWALFRSDAIDRLVTQAVDHNRTWAASIAT